ncbi:MAG: DUF4258 domain-containing protein [Planctomycetota bacterium]|jgi:hypothetical protein
MIPARRAVDSLDFDAVVFSGHAVRRMFERAIDADSVRHVLRYGEVIAEYPDDKPLPSRLLLALVGDRPLHVVAALDADARGCYVVSVYEPDPGLWDEGFRRRRSP